MSCRTKKKIDVKIVAKLGENLVSVFISGQQINEYFQHIKKDVPKDTQYISIELLQDNKTKILVNSILHVFDLNDLLLYVHVLCLL